MQKFCIALFLLKTYRKELGNFLKSLSFSEAEEFADLLAKASSHNTYIETISNKADTIHYQITKNYVEILPIEHFEYVRKRLKGLRLGAVDIIVDITKENFYGETSGFYIHPWTGEKGVSARFLYLVAGILFRNKIYPFYVALLQLGSFKATHLGKIVEYCNKMQLHVSSMKLDRGFYSGEIINELEMREINYLIFVPKNSLFKSMLEGTKSSVIVKHEIKYSRNKSTHLASTNIVLVKDVLGYDWVFATNFILFDTPKYVRLYKKRWNIETMFRVHDEARIKTKSIKPIIRLFYFIVSMMLLFFWNLCAKLIYTFKRFIIALAELSQTEIILVN